MYIGVDLGSTNIKTALYDDTMTLVDRRSIGVEYVREEGLVEFDARQYFLNLRDLLGQMLREKGVKHVREIAFTGQAESLVVLDGEGNPLMNAISWMDERSTQECAVLAERFPAHICEAVTGQQAVLPTWPATKILWLKEHRPEVYQNAACYMLLKDYIVYCLTGVKAADMSIATFSFYFDIYRKTYWQEMLEAIGISQEQLPPLCEPCTCAGALLPELTAHLGLENAPQINVGTLDHFAGMIGTGNIAPGMLTLSTGTVMALATMSGASVPVNSGIAMHYGFLPDTHVMLPVAESGGVSLEWFKRSCMAADFDTMNQELVRRGSSEILFLPYLVGTGAPEFDAGTTGVFWGLRQEHDAIDMAGAVMEGVSFVLRKNCEYIARNGVKLTAIVATGGGAKNPVWCQMQADITGIAVSVPEEKEAACLGAAMIAAVSNGKFADFGEAAAYCVRMQRVYRPNSSAHLEKKYRRFCALYQWALQINGIH